jgi:protein involved in polysaccharide export with SLBB domain
MSESEYKYFQARLNEKVGVMAISFPKLMADYNSEDNIILQNRDSIIVPEKKYFVNVQGRVNNPGLVVYKPDYNYLDYINAAGGFGFRSDEGATMIVKSKGQQFDAEEMNYTIAPGDYILVPPKKDIGWGQIAMTTLTVVAQIVAIGGVIIALTR